MAFSILVCLCICTVLVCDYGDHCGWSLQPIRCSDVRAVCTATWKFWTGAGPGEPKARLPLTGTLQTTAQAMTLIHLLGLSCSAVGTVMSCRHGTPTWFRFRIYLIFCHCRKIFYFSYGKLFGFWVGKTLQFCVLDWGAERAPPLFALLGYIYIQYIFFIMCKNFQSVSAISLHSWKWHKWYIWRKTGWTNTLRSNNYVQKYLLFQLGVIHVVS